MPEDLRALTHRRRPDRVSLQEQNEYPLPKEHIWATVLLSGIIL